MNKTLFILLSLLFQGASLFAAWPTPSPTATRVPSVWPKDPKGNPASYVAVGSFNPTTGAFTPLDANSASQIAALLGISNSAATAAQGASRSAAALEAAPSFRPDDPGYVKASGTAESFVSLWITPPASGVNAITILPAPGAGYKYRIRSADWSFPSGCTCAAAAMVQTDLMSGSTILSGSRHGFYKHTGVTSTIGSDLGAVFDWRQTFFDTGVNEILYWRIWLPSNMGGVCYPFLNLSYQTIPQ